MSSRTLWSAMTKSIASLPRAGSIDLIEWPVPSEMLLVASTEAVGLLAASSNILSA